MESKLIEPANGECIGRWHSIADKTIVFTLTTLLISFGLLFISKDGDEIIKVMLNFVLYIIFLFVFVFFFKGPLFRLEASRRLFVSEKGLVLNNKLYKYEVIEISTIYLDRNIIKFKCMYKIPRLSLRGGFKIKESEFEYKIEKRFREKPNELLKYLNNLCDQKIKKLKE
jgi:hypothetical protein